MCSFRFGEASHPGPQCESFVLGAVNPTGLNGKHSLVSQLPPGVYGVSESHLTSRGIQLFRSGLQFAGSTFRYVAGPAVPSRSRSSVTGDYSGVGFLSSFPGRPAPHAVDKSMWATARLQFASFLVGSVWLLGAVVYGFPVAPASTEALLEAVTQRVVLQGSGPRFICGDFNLEPQALAARTQWAQHGFVDVQDLFFQRSGNAPGPTCKATARKDYVMISPEMHGLLQSVSLDDTWFPDHTLLAATFRAKGLDIPFPVWRRPRQRDLADLDPLPEFDPGLLPHDPTEAYTVICRAYEASLATGLETKGHPELRGGEKGRATTRDVSFIKPNHAQVPVSRYGEVQPFFFGPDRQYTLWLRQLRRLQALMQALAKGTATPAAVAYRLGLWSAIRDAAGFTPSFRDWWRVRPIQLACDLQEVPQHLPGPAQVELLFSSMQANWRRLEAVLLRTRHKVAKLRRRQEPHLIFRDLKPPRAQPVETLVQPVIEPREESSHVEVEAPESGGLERPPQTGLLEPKMGVCRGVASEVPAPPPAPKYRLLGDLPSLFRAFGDEWAKRWMKHENVDPARWNGLLSDFAGEAFCEPCEVATITVEVWRAAVKAKHPFSATGLDGVSRADLLAMTPLQVQGLLTICARAEADGCWPAQLLDASVTAVEKFEDAQSVSQYRPICVLALPYRTWSSIRAREALQHLSRIAPETMVGNMPGRAAGGIWYRLQMEIENSYATGRPLAGGFLDLTKAFNTLPRAPVFVLAIRMGIPRPVVRAWSAAVAGLSRRFKIRGASGPPLPSFTGFAEGDALSCVAMALVDIALHRFTHLRAPSATLSTFVDDWQIQGNAAATVTHALSAVADFSEAWDIKLDATKTVVWATAASDRKQLRRVGHEVAHSARTLGGHAAFSRQRTNSTLQARLARLPDLWPRLSASFAPYNQKVRALTTAAWPRALHAVSTAPLGASRFEAMRSGAARGLDMSRPGVNPEILLGLVEYPKADPEFYALRSSFLDLRSFSLMEQVGPLLDAAVDDQAPGVGPAKLLLERAHSVGWSWSPSTQRFIDSISAFDPWQVSQQELDLRLTFAWQRRVGFRLSGRRGFQGLQDADPHLTRTLLKGWNPADRKAIILALTGAFYTQDALHHFSSDPSESPLCRHCGCRDSIAHRVWDCPGFEDVRWAADPLLQPNSFDLCPAQAEHAWVMRPRQQVQFWAALAALPDLTGSFHEGVARDS